LSGGEEKKRLYDETASLVADLGLRGRIAEDEMLFLLNLLDQVMVKQEYPELAGLLRRWLALKPQGEINEIIKATLLTMDFNDLRAVQANLELIQELLDGQ